MTSLGLAVGHHLLAFALLGILAAERALMVGRLSPEKVNRLASIDAAYGAVAAGIVLVGFGRVFLGGKGPDFYFSNPLFWAKIATFVVVALLSIVPTLRILVWRRSVRRDPAFSPAPEDISKVRRFLSLELTLFPLIPAFAAAMAMGIGLP